MLSPTMTKGIIANWLVEVGDNVTAGDIIVEVETDKVTIEVEANDDGVIGELFAQIGDEVPVQNVIATLKAPGTVIEKSEKPVSESDAIVETNIATPAIIEATSSLVDSSPADSFPSGSLPSSFLPSDNGALNMSPLARRMAEQQHIDANKIIGSGAKGKIVKQNLVKIC